MNFEFIAACIFLNCGNIFHVLFTFNFQFIKGIILPVTEKVKPEPTPTTPEAQMDETEPVTEKEEKEEIVEVVTLKGKNRCFQSDINAHDIFPAHIHLSLYISLLIHSMFLFSIWSNVFM